MTSSQKRGWLIAAGIAAALAVLLYVRKAKAKTKTAVDTDEVPSVPAPIFTLPPKAVVKRVVSPPPAPPEDKIDPLSPKSRPEHGDYYAVVRGDNMSKILKAAGHTSVYQAYLAMLAHSQNAWIGTKRDGQGNEVLRLNKRFEALPGYESKSWAHGTKYRPNTQGKWPVVYVPSLDEV